MNGQKPGTEIRVATWSHGVVPVIICPLCGALVVTEAVEQHARVHALAVEDLPQQDPRC
ncbi:MULTISPECIES: hypothetical protein [Pseudonocardia]|uniref:C2H2-type domain-containing protein n=2 Tax=Pseudonocardia TaxID=1847 RepID=A0A1Y2N8S1_PSEAH|nr:MULTISPECIES: hypothetical protein [Pseudonocardia]OSY43569.1 hypothetical protein BG845_00512 [Pseudonocardia autotrophica]TDN73440.1 hypothetical protein C8E95_2537 [Pseudonocardia autotrophica]BBG04179.1 hypothetical protein Pdca_53880 [Pseudonocardia autotrophica]GEC25510.1 hypothetical protein PSA01_25390 [Pseudonocardia saturnea]